MTEPHAATGPAISDAAREELDGLLRRCIQCGLCLPVCATWLATGDETMSPRGRLLLWGEVLADPAAATADTGWREALDSCLGCLACTAVCPSTVIATQWPLAAPANIQRQIEGSAFSLLLLPTDASRRTAKGRARPATSAARVSGRWWTAGLGA